MSEEPVVNPDAFRDELKHLYLEKNLHRTHLIAMHFVDRTDRLESENELLKSENDKLKEDIVGAQTISNLRFREVERLQAAYKRAIEALKAARIDVWEGGHASDIEGIAAKCPDCSLCIVDAALSESQTLLEGRKDEKMCVCTHEKDAHDKYGVCKDDYPNGSGQCDCCVFREK